jgi:hypothetical protein
MAQPHRFQFLLRKALWLLMPLIGLGIWIITAWMTDWVLSNASLPMSQLQTELYPTAQFARTLTITSISARIDRSENVAEVTFTTEDLPLKRLEFKLPLIDPAALETALANELKTTPAAIQSLIQYQIR